MYYFTTHSKSCSCIFPFLSIASEKENEEMALHHIIQYVKHNYAVALDFMLYWLLNFLNATMEYHSIS